MNALQKWSVIILTAVGLLLVSVALDSPVQAQAKHECSWCHDLHGGGGAVPLTAFGTDQELCLSCHQDGPPLQWAGIDIPKGVSVHSGVKYGAFEASCVDCHDHNGETTNLKLIGGSDGSGNAVVDHWGKFAGGADKPVVYTATTGADSLADGTGPPYDSLCQVCHSKTRDSDDTMNRHQQGEVSPDSHNQGSNCVTCHLHSANFSGAGGGCTGCHNQAQGPRRDVLSEFSYSSHHINWVAAGYASTADIPDSDCEVCHNQGTHQDGVVDLNDVDTGAAGVYNMAVAADVTTFCTKCHDADAALDLGGAPFSDGMIPPVIDGAAWPSTEHGVNFTAGPDRACLQCHTSGHGKQKADLNVVCETCHGASGTAKFAAPHYDPHNVPVNYSWYCTTCHTPHTNLKNKFYTDGTPHPHYTGTGILESTVADGYNIKLFGRDEDGSGVTKLRTPMKIITALTDGSGPCAASNTELEIFLPPYLPDGEGVAFTIMVGDRLELDNTDATFDGVYRVKETVWDNLTADPPTGWVCYDHPTNAPYAGTGWVQSGGWFPKPVIQSAEVVSNVATLYFSGPTSIIYGIHAIQIADIINVIGVGNAVFNGQQTVTAVTETSVSFSKITGDTTGTGGTLEYVGSVKEINNVTILGPPLPPPISITDASWRDPGGPTPGRGTIVVGTHPYSQNDNVTVSGVTPSGYNGTYLVTSVSATEIEYDLPANPGAYVSGGSVPDFPSGSYNLVVTLNTNNNDAAILDMKAASAGLRDGDIVRIYGASPGEYNERWEIDEGGIDVSTNPPTITLRCPPYMRTDTSPMLPFCDIASMGAYVSGGTLQSTGTMREVVFDSRGTDHSDGVFLGDYGHSFTNTDLPSLTEDGYMYGPCETCHTGDAMANHQTFDYGNTHNNGRTCSLGCHWHSIGFDKGSDACPRATCISN